MYETMTKLCADIDGMLFIYLFIYLFHLFSSFIFLFLLLSYHIYFLFLDEIEIQTKLNENQKLVDAAVLNLTNLHGRLDLSQRGIKNKLDQLNKWVEETEKTMKEDEEQHQQASTPVTTATTATATNATAIPSSSSLNKRLEPYDKLSTQITQIVAEINGIEDTLYILDNILGG